MAMCWPMTSSILPKSYVLYQKCQIQIESDISAQLRWWPPRWSIQKVAPRNDEKASYFAQTYVSHRAKIISSVPCQFHLGTTDQSHGVCISRGRGKLERLNLVDSPNLGWGRRCFLSIRQSVYRYWRNILLRVINHYWEGLVLSLGNQRMGLMISGYDRRSHWRASYSESPLSKNEIWSLPLPPNSSWLIIWTGLIQIVQTLGG